MAIALALALLMSACSDQVVTGTATGTWRIAANRWTYTQVTQSGCVPDREEVPAVMPIDGAGERGGRQNVRDCAQATCDTREVTVARKCSTGTCSQYAVSAGRCSPSELGRTVELCERETTQKVAVKGTRCTYDTWEWKLTDQAEQFGDGFAPPEAVGLAGPVGPLQRAEVSENYSVLVEAGGRTSTEFIQSREHYLMFASGKVTALKVRGAPLLTQIHPVPGS
ncbi:hypothetical protein LBMAG42_37460 [Deltaproteobacteria bacterium]|nr:hypothetical protein LBMAG42_37460 [Deltaproteobacteria bacterium]